MILDREQCRHGAEVTRDVVRLEPRSPTIAPVGFNPFRKQRTSTIDIALVVGFVVLTLGLVAWGFFG